MRAILGAALFASAGAGVALSSCLDGSPSESPAGESPVDASRDSALANDASGDAAVATDAALDASVPLVDTCGDAAAAVADVWLADPHLCLVTAGLLGSHF